MDNQNHKIKIWMHCITKWYKTNHLLLITCAYTTMARVLWGLQLTKKTQTKPDQRDLKLMSLICRLDTKIHYICDKDTDYSPTPLLQESCHPSRLSKEWSVCKPEDDSDNVIALIKPSYQTNRSKILKHQPHWSKIHKTTLMTSQQATNNIKTASQCCSKVRRTMIKTRWTRQSGYFDPCSTL